MGTVLLADPDIAHCQGLALALEQAGHTVRPFTDGIDAWDAAASRPEVLIVNAVFPEGQPHGIAIAMRARSARPQARVIFIAPHRSFAFTHLDGECYLVKPFEPATLLAIIDEVPL